MYYIKKVIDDSVVLANNFETKEVPISELRSIKDIILGYNKLTGSVKVVGTEEIKRYIISNCRLCNIEPPKIVDNFCAIVNPIIEIDTEQEVVNVTISTNMIAHELIQGYEIWYSSIFERAVYKYLMYFPDCEEIYINLIYDISGVGELKCEPVVLCSYSELLTFSGGGREIHLDNISFTDNCDFTKFDTISGLFKYVVSDREEESIREIESYYAFIDVTDCIINMSKIVFDSHTKLEGIIGGMLPLAINPPKFTNDCDKPDLNTFVHGAILNDEFDIRKLCKLKSEISSDNIHMSYCIAKHSVDLNDMIGKGIIFDDFIVYHLTLDTCYKEVERGDYIISGSVEPLEHCNGTLRISDAFFGFIALLTDECKSFLRRWRKLLDEENKTVEEVKEIFMTKFEEELKAKGGYYPCKILSQLYVHLNGVDVDIELTENDNYRSEKFALYNLLSYY